jgi:phosphoglycolate phosphatase
MKYQNVLFDLDGTLTDSSLGITNSVMYALEKMGLSVPEREKLYPFIGPPLRESFEKFCGLSQMDAEKAVSCYREYYSKTGIFENEVIAGIPELLQFLNAQNVCCLVATSKPEKFTRMILEHFDLMQYFSFCACASMDSSHVEKPQIVADALQHCQGNSVMIGDRFHDVYGAKANNIPCIGVLFGFGSREELENAGADFIASDMDELRNLLS